VFLVPKWIPDQTQRPLLLRPRNESERVHRSNNLHTMHSWLLVLLP